MNYLSSKRDAWGGHKIKVFRWAVFIFKRDLPRFFTHGGAIHRVWLYSMPLKLAPKPSQLYNQLFFSVSIRWLRKMGWISLKSKTRYQLHKTELELRIEPRSWQGRLLLKFGVQKATKLLATWNRIIYDTATRPNQPLSDSALFLMFKLLCRLQVRFRFSSVFFLPVHKLESTKSQFGPSWLFSADIYFANDFRLPTWLTHIWPKLQNLITINSKLISVNPIYISNGRILNGLLINDLPIGRPRYINPKQNQYFFNFENQQVRLKPGKYGGFDQNFPFQNLSQIYYLFRETEDGQIHGYGLQASYAANHLQRFSISAIKQNKKLAENQFCLPKQSIQKQEVNLLNFDSSSFSIYLSQLELRIVDYFVADRTEFLWRAKLNSPPKDLPVLV